MAQDIIKNIPITLDINARKRLDGIIDIRLYSKDIATGQFEFTFIDEDGDQVALDETYTAQALVRYNDEETTYLNDMTIDRNIIRFIFPHDFITKDGTVTMYIYITKNNYTSDVAAISFPVFVSEIDKDLDPSVAVHYIGKIEQLIQDMKDEIASYQVDVDMIIAGYEESISKLQALETDYEPRLVSLDAQLAQTMSQVDFDSWVATLLDGGPSIFMETLTALNTAYPNGASGIALVRETNPAKIYVWNGTIWEDYGDYQGFEINDGAVTNSKIKAGDVTADKIDGANLSKSVNLFDKQKITNGYYINNSGETLPSAILGFSDYIRVKPNTQYIFFNEGEYSGTINNHRGAWYDENKVRIEAISGDTNTICITDASPSNARYVRFNISLPKIDRYMWVEGTSYPSQYVPFQYEGEIDWLRVNASNLTEEVKNSLSEIKTGDITPDKIDGVSFSKSVNLFDKQKVTHGYYIGNAAGDILPMPIVGISDYIRVKPNTQYVFFNEGPDPGSINVHRGSWYDGNKVRIDTIRGDENPICTTNASPSNAYYARINITLAKIDQYMFVEGTTYPSEFIPFKHEGEIDWLRVNDSNLTDELKNSLSEKSRFYNKTVNFLGDSTTKAQVGPTSPDKGYATLVANALGFTEQNYGVNGTRIAQQTGDANSFVERYVNMNPADLIVVAGGINDFFSGTAQLGESDSADPYTFNGALNVLMSGLKAQFPLSDLLFMTPIQSHFGGRSTDAPNPNSNATLNDYRQAILNRADYHGIATLDLYSIASMDGAHSVEHRQTYFSDGLHWNDLGNERVANRLIGRLKSM